jgi:hypothetical protein
MTLRRFIYPFRCRLADKLNWNDFNCIVVENTEFISLVVAYIRSERTFQDLADTRRELYKRATKGETLGF